MANRTRGADRGEHGRHGQKPWRENQVILTRMQEGAKLRSHGLTGAEIAIRQGVHISVVYEDRDRLVELRKEQALQAVDEHIENLRQQAAEIRAALDGTDRRSLNVGQLRGLLRQIEMDMAKLDGSLIDRKEIQGEVRTIQGLLSQVREKPTGNPAE